jgi:hypothetical protein
MKKTFLLFLLFLVIKSYATHLMYGQIAVKHLSSVGTARTYEVSITISRDCLNGQADFDDPLRVGVFNLITNSLITYENFTLTQRTRGAAYQDSGVCVERAVYIKNITVYGDFYITSARGYRIANILNIDNSDGYLGVSIYTEVHTDLQGSSISTPAYNYPLLVSTGKNNSFDLSSVDNISDSTSYEFSIPLNGADKSHPNPDPPSKPYLPTPFNTGYSLNNLLGSLNSISINRQSGILSLDINVQGIYAIGITVTKFKNGAILYKQVRDLTIIAGPGFTPLTVEHKEIKNSGLIIFPNPAGNILNVNLENYSSQGTITISIFNIEGKLMKKEILNTINSIDITNLEKGIYQIQVIIGDKISNSKFIKL